MTRSRGVKIAIGVVVTVACLAVLLWRIENPSAIRAAFARADYRTLPLFWGLLTLFYWLKAVRWALLLAPLRPSDPLRAKQVLPALMTGFMGNNLLPAHLGEFIRVFLLGRQFQLPKTTILATVVVERLCDVAAILAILLWGLALTPQASPGLISASYIVGFVLAAAVIGLAIFAWKTVWFVRMAEGILARIPLVPASLKIKVCGLLESGALGMAAFHHGRLTFAIIATSLAQWVLNVATISLSLYAFNIEQPAAVAAVVMGVVAFGVTVPSTPGFFGVIQACFALALEPLGVPAADVFAASIFYHLSQYVPVTLIGLYFLNRAGLRLGELEHVAEETEEQTIEHPVGLPADLQLSAAGQQTEDAVSSQRN